MHVQTRLRKVLESLVDLLDIRRERKVDRLLLSLQAQCSVEALHLLLRRHKAQSRSQYLCILERTNKAAEEALRCPPEACALLGRFRSGMGATVIDIIREMLDCYLVRFRGRRNELSEFLKKKTMFGVRAFCIC